ncbi:hypothetical protein HJG40_05320 [Acidithiobacillus sp. ATCC 19703]|uniref:Uncharacterized protein n=1 Tax=Acidithiobacillus concretivorus TaxID=3063952 RepID=A0ABS5ZNJ0_9PROT|nr:hypothetical protein [Acidithiobacillus concretivorus]
MKATLITHFRDVAPNSDLLEMVVWRVPQPVPPCEHDFKYSLVYVANGTRVIGYDNERGKGDHVHFAGEESAYAFISVDQLVEDFIAEVERWKREH